MMVEAGALLMLARRQCSGRCEACGNDDQWSDGLGYMCKKCRFDSVFDHVILSSYDPVTKTFEYEGQR